MTGKHPTIAELELDLQTHFNNLDEISSHNHRKVSNAFSKTGLASEHFNSGSGYGHDETGRQKLDQLFAHCFGTEAALVRASLVSGTHAIACAIEGNLKPGDELIFALGKPYDTLEPMLVRLKERLGVKVTIHEPADWNDLNSLKVSLLASLTPDTKMIAFQRSRGYSPTRPSLNVETLGELMQTAKKAAPEALIFVDNCYGEFVEKLEPSELGADLIAGSLIKNPGGGIVTSGAYIAGTTEAVGLAAERFTAAGIGAEGGVSFGTLRSIALGLYLAPLIVTQALKSMVLAARVLSSRGLGVSPSWSEERSDIIQRVDLGSRERIVAFCSALQAAGPVDAHLTPVPAVTPGYCDELIMAAGTFVEGSTIEFSADGPLREPFCVFLQGGLSYQYTRLFFMSEVFEGFLG